MAVDAGIPKRAFLTARLPGAEPPPYLLLDAHDQRTVMEVEADRGAPTAPAGSLVVIDGRRAEARPRPGGGLLVTRALLWSLLDPCAATRGQCLDAVDRVEAERLLRAEAARLAEGLGWWRKLPAVERAACRELCAAAGLGPARLARWVEARAREAGGPAAAGFASIPGGTPAPSPPAPLPAPPDPEPDGVAAWFTSPAGLGGLLAEGFAVRPQQAEMAAEVMRALAADTPLLIEAGTGIGKTLAYLLPLLVAIAGGGGRAVVATHTRALQGQILEQELPRLACLFPGLRSRLLMGRRNYLCRRRRLQFLARAAAQHGPAVLAAFRLWLAATGSGQREELAGHPLLGPHLAELFDSPEPCSPAVCQGNDECFVQRARRLAREADLVVVNHSLLMNDFAAGHALAGPFTRLVVDEAHRLPAAALDVSAVRCDSGRLWVLEELVGEARPGGGVPELAAELARDAAALPEPVRGAALAAATGAGEAFAAGFLAYRAWLAALARRWDEAAAAVEVRPAGRVRIHDGDEVFGPLRAETAAWLAAAERVTEAAAGLERSLAGLEMPAAGLQERVATMARAAELVEALRRDVRFVTAAGDPDWVYWLEPDPAAGVRAAGATLLEAGGLLGECWRGAGLAPILTSATLSIAGDFEFMRAELGLQGWRPPAGAAVIDSPFAHERQALYLTLGDMPPPDSPRFAEAVADLLGALSRAVRRKTLALFTSYRTLQEVAARLGVGAPTDDLFAAAGQGRAPSPAGAPVVLAQAPGGDAAALLARFRRERRAILLGTTTFWEGVDFPGSELEVLVVTRLPFQVPADPWVEARCERIRAAGENDFETFMVRDAVLRLRQGTGRLIRRHDDRGVVLLLDSRLHTMPYGVTFLNALPVSPRYCPDARDAIERVAAFFAAGERPPPAAPRAPEA